jgi:hypothetical protein
MANPRGMPTALIRPTPHEPRNGDQAEELIEREEPRNGDQAEELIEGEGRGDTTPKPKPRRAPKKTLEEKGKGRKLVLTDSLFDRLQLYAIKKRLTVSAAAADVLNRNLPKLRIADE